MIELFTASTPNGHKASIALEELEIPYKVVGIDLGAKQQKEEWFLAMNPNGRIPVIKDQDNDDFVVFESGAILIYLAEKAGRLLPPDPKMRSEVIQWLMFQMGNLGPMMGQANIFYRYADEKIPYAIARYQRESRRLLAVLDLQLQNRTYLAEAFSIADIACFTWARTHEWAGVDIAGLNALSDWLARMEDRPAVQRGLAVPHKKDYTDTKTQEESINTARSILA